MSSLFLGVLNIYILKSKNLEKIENGTKKNLTIKNPIIKIEYMSETRISIPAEDRGDSFEWNFKLNLDLIKDKTSFLMQCYNNNTEDSVNLIGETRIPLILVIENEKFKQWYPIYSKEKKNKFVCRGEILLDMHFYSNEKLKNNKTYFSTMVEDYRRKQNYPVNVPERSSSLYKSANFYYSDSNYDNTIDEAEFKIQLPPIKIRITKNYGNTSNNVCKYLTFNLENNQLYEDNDDNHYDDEFSENKFNDSYYYKNKKEVERTDSPVSFSAVDLRHSLENNDINEISKSYSVCTCTNFKLDKLNHFNSSPSLKNSKSKFSLEMNKKTPLLKESSNTMVIPLKSPKSLTSSTTLIHNASSKLKMDDISSELDIKNKRISVATTSDIPYHRFSDIPNHRIYDIPNHRFSDIPNHRALDISNHQFSDIIDSRIRYKWKGSLPRSLPRSLQKISSNNKYNCRKSISDNDYSIDNYDIKNESFISFSSSYSPLSKYNTITTINDKPLNNITNRQSRFCDMEFNKNSNAPMKVRSFQSLMDTPSPTIKPNSPNFSMVNNYSNSIKNVSSSSSDNSFDVNIKEKQKQIKIESDGQLNHNNIIKSFSRNQKKSITMNELTQEERDFIKKMNEKYNTSIIVIDENISLSYDEDENKNEFNVKKLIKENEESKGENSEKFTSEKSSKNIFKRLFSSKNKKKKKSKNKNNKANSIIIKSNNNNKILKKIRSIISIQSLKNEKGKK